MASQSYRNIVAVLALCEGCAVTLKDFYLGRPRNKTALGHINKLEQSSKSALAHWPGGLTTREVKQIADSMKGAEEAAFLNEETAHPISYTSLSLGLLNDLFDHIKDAGRLMLIENVHRDLWRIHRYLDRSGRHYDLYAQATRAVEVWHRKMAVDI